MNRVSTPRSWTYVRWCRWTSKPSSSRCVGPEERSSYTTPSNSQAPVQRSSPLCRRNASVSSPRRSSGWPHDSFRHRQRRRWRRSCIHRQHGSSRQRSERSRPRVRMADFVIRIPRVSVAVSEAELTEFLVSAGEHVDEGTPIYVIATEKVEQEIEAGASGTVQWTGQIGTTYDIGTQIGVITS